MFHAVKTLIMNDDHGKSIFVVLEQGLVITNQFLFSEYP